MLGKNEVGWSFDLTDNPEVWMNYTITGIDLFVNTNELDKEFNELVKWNLQDGKGLQWTDEDPLLGSFRLISDSEINVSDETMFSEFCNLYKFHSNPEMLYGYDIVHNNNKFLDANASTSGVYCDKLDDIFRKAMTNLGIYNRNDVLTTCGTGITENQGHLIMVIFDDAVEYLLNQIGRSLSEIRN